MQAAPGRGSLCQDVLMDASLSDAVLLVFLLGSSLVFIKQVFLERLLHATQLAVPEVQERKQTKTDALGELVAQ